MFSLSVICRGFCDVWFCAWCSWSGCGCVVGCGWIVGWCDCWFCGGCAVDDGDVERVVFDRGSGKESVECGDNKFVWCEDMVENGFVHLVAEKSANATDDGYRFIVHVDVEDREDK